MINRREFTFGCLAFGGAALLGKYASTVSANALLPPWSWGELDIHHIDTGRGNATFLIAPDGTTLLIDCGASNDGADVSAPCRPDASHRPGEWVARYALQQAKAAGRDTLDYLIATHIHPDHVGDIPEGMGAPSGDNFIATGLSQVDQLMPAAVAIDRSFPDYGALPPPDAPYAANYLAWLHARQRAGRTVEKLEVGSASQIHLRGTTHPSFSVRALAANGRVWTGSGENTGSLFPDFTKLPPTDHPSENACSIALRVSYGRFSYFTGGDLTADTHDGRFPWMDVETPVARAARQVEVALANHHGYFDSCGPEFTKALNAQAYVIPAWHVTHPGPAQMERLIGAWPGEKPRDVFATESLPANRLINSRWIPQMKSLQGHVVIRVAPGGGSFRIFVTDSTQENGPVILECGPYLCRA
jgi:beta-lactamase superfamily II metal-dependent hydrolase